MIFFLSLGHVGREKKNSVGYLSLGRWEKYINICAESTAARVSVLSSRWQKVSGEENLFLRIAPRGAIEMKVCM
jgi:hypothetical protein